MAATCRAVGGEVCVTAALLGRGLRKYGGLGLGEMEMGKVCVRTRRCRRGFDSVNYESLFLSHCEISSPPVDVRIDGGPERDQSPIATSNNQRLVQELLHIFRRRLETSLASSYSLWKGFHCPSSR